MLMFLITGFMVFIYEFWSLVLPLKISWFWRIAVACPVFVGACRNSIYSVIGGRMFYTPEFPLWVLLTGAWLYTAACIAFFLLVAKDTVWLLWKIFVRTKAFPAGSASILIIAVSVVLSLYGTWAAVKAPDVKYTTAYIKELPRQLEGVKIALLADLHISAMNKGPLIAKIVERANAEKPDIVLINGDIIDGAVKTRENDVKPLASLKAKYGVYGSAGNHEYYSGYGEWKEKFKELGITMLENSHDTLDVEGGKLVIAGVPDKNSMRFGYEGPNPNAALAGVPLGAPIIMMSHRPETAEQIAAAGADIQLSGHTHGGMVLGMDKIVGRFNAGYTRGWYKVKDMNMYVSPGTLLWNGFAIRLGVPSEITVITLRRGAA